MVIFFHHSSHHKRYEILNVNIFDHVAETNTYTKLMVVWHFKPIHTLNEWPFIFSRWMSFLSLVSIFVLHLTLVKETLVWSLWTPTSSKGDCVYLLI